MEQNQLKFIYLSESELPPREMLEKLMVLGKECKNCFFEYFWSQNGAEMSANDDVSFQLIMKKVWKPTILNCENILCTFQNKSISIKEMRKYESLQNIGFHLNALCSGMHKCYSNSESFPSPGVWIQQLVNHINLFSRIFGNGNINISEYCLSLKESLGLEGDFTKLMELNQVSMIKETFYWLMQHLTCYCQTISAGHTVKLWHQWQMTEQLSYYWLALIIFPKTFILHCHEDLWLQVH